ncbi:YibE/F family protein [Cellulomonas humilata]|uniref:Membrane protein n=1 Tax=Cellulomonas humilata TaxID=144055 RepID=A0ABU0EHQ0_9CELL|nr:YibE/F family protein [Cellulomonas humilata]MDQ0374810.1 putative membrane protein [Cellulomonas humilata]
MSAHTHDVVPASPQVRRHARRVFTAILVPALLVTLLGAWVLWPTGERPVLETSPPGMTFPTVTVVEVFPDAADPLRQVRATMADGSSAWVQVPPEYLPEIDPGDRVIAADLGSLGTPETGLVFTDFVRGPPLGLLAAVFAVLVVAVARWRGFAALLGLGISMGVIGAFMLPALLEGKPALPVALVTSSAIMFVVLYLAHGFTLRTSTALVGTLLGLLATGFLATWASGAAHLTGLSGEYALDLLSYAPQARMSAILLCGMVIAGLGVLNDVTITQASAVWELHGSSPDAGWRELFGRGMRIGRDHIASTVYTIVFAYVGATLPLVLLVSISDRGMLDALTSGELAEEVARTLVGSIGLVLAIPLTTAIAAWVVRSGRPAPTTAVEPELVDVGVP